MLRKLLLIIGFSLLFFIRPLESGAQVPVTIKCENNAKTVTDIRVQITFPSGEMKAYDGKNLESEVLEYHIEGTGECKLFIHFKEEGVKAPTFISKKFMISGEEKRIDVYTSMNLRSMVIPCNSEYSNRKYCILFIKKIYPECPEGRYPKGYENDSERTNLWEYSLQSIVQK